MKSFVCIGLIAMALTAQAAPEKFLTYNQATEVNLRDAAGLEADARETNVLIAEGNAIYGATSGDVCHVFRFDAETRKVEVLSTVPGTNTVMRGLAVDGDTVYVGTMLTKEQLWLKIRKLQPDVDPTDAHLLPIKAEAPHGAAIADVHVTNPV